MTTRPEDVVSHASTARADSPALKTILMAGLVGGACDITYAFILWGLRGVSPIRIGQSIASGLLGRETAVAGGFTTGLLGLFLHFVMAIIMAAFYYFAATKLPILWKRATVLGPLYGLGLYGVMNYVVIPLSAIGGGKGGAGPTYIWVTGILVHMFLVGLPIALFTRRALRDS